MAYQGVGALNYFPCRYGKSKLLFRGPKKPVCDDSIVFVGGTETYGKFVETPFCDLVGTSLQVSSINFGCVNAGLDVFLGDEIVMDIGARAKVLVLQMPGAQNMSNRLYTVHPRRNDRFLQASFELQSLFPEIDFTDFNFTRHLLKALKEHSEDRFAIVQQELKSAWVARMREMLEQLSGDVVLLWLADHTLEDVTACNAVGRDPLFVDRGMVDEIRGMAMEVVEVVGSPQQIAQGYELMTYSDLDALSAREMLGSVVHGMAAASLVDVIEARL